MSNHHRIRTARRTVGYAVPAALLLVLVPTSARADDGLDHLREVMKTHQPAGPAYDDDVAQVLPRMVIAAHAANVQATLTDLTHN
jgi:hypothetical protein